MRPATTTCDIDRWVARVGLAAASFLLLVVTLLVLLLLAAGPAGAQQGTAGGDGAGIEGRVQHRDGEGAAGLVVTLATTAWPEGVDVVRDVGSTDATGRFTFDDLDADCYRVTIEAPPGASFAAGRVQHTATACVDPGQTDTSIDEVLTAGRAGEPFSMTVLHTGDHEGQLLPETVVLEIDGESVTLPAGGFPRLVAAMTERRATAGEEATVAIHTGNALTGTALYTVFGGAADAALMNEACFDLFAPGPHELGRSERSFAAFLDFLADGACGTEVLTGWAVLTVGADSVGFVHAPAGTPDRVEAAQAAIDELADRGVVNVVVVSGAGYGADLLLASRLAGADAIVGGDRATLLGPFDEVGLESGGPYPTVTTGADQAPVCIVGGWQGAKLLGELVIDFDGAGGIEGCRGSPHLLLGSPAEPLTPGVVAALDARPGLRFVEPDPAATETLAAYIRTFEHLVGNPIATVDQRLCLTTVPGQMVGLLCEADGRAIDTTDLRPDTQRIVTDAMRVVGRGDVALLDGGSARNEIGAGPLSIAAAYQLLPDGHRLVTLQVTGAELAAVIEEAIERAIGAEGTGWLAYPHTSGLGWKADLDRPAGERVGPLLILAVGRRWEEVDPAGRYLLVTTDFLAAGGRRYEQLQNLAGDGRRVTRGIAVAQALADDIDQRLGGVVLPPDLGPTGWSGANEDQPSD